MSWHRISEDQLFTHSRISAAGSSGLFSIEDDERALRDAWHTEADVRQGVLKRVLLSLIQPEAGVARGTTNAAARTEEWLKMCGDKAVDEVGALARRKDAPQLEAKVLRTRVGAVRDRTDLDAGARIIGVAPGEELSELADHLIFLPRLDTDEDDDSALAVSRAPTPIGNSEVGEYYIVLANHKNELALFGLVPVRWAALPAPPSTPTRVANSKTNIVTRPDRKQRPNNYFACLQGDEATVTAQAFAAADRDAEIVEEVDLHGKTVSEAIEQVLAILDKHAHGATEVTRGSNARQRHVHFVVGIGKHSEDGVAQIKPLVERELSKRRVRYGTVRDNAGMLWADVETIQPLPLARECVLTFQDLGYIGDTLHLLANVQHLLRRGKWPRITNALAAPNNRTLLPATLFKGRCSFKELQLPEHCAAGCDQQALAIRSIEHNLSAIQGPPGTGKTSLIANILEYALPNLTTLVTCVQNKALEPIAQKLAANGVKFVVLVGCSQPIYEEFAGRELCAATGEGGIGFGGGASGACSVTPAGGAQVGFGAAFDTPVGSEKKRAVDKLGSTCRNNTLAVLASREMPPAFSQAVRRLAKVIKLGGAEEDLQGRAEEEEEEGTEKSRWGLMVARLYERIVMWRLAEAWRAHKESEILRDTTVFLSTIDRANTVHHLLYERKRALDVIIVDEAGAVPEWKMPALARCGGGGNDGRGGPELIILVGDQKQLPPFSHNRDETPISVLEKMAKSLPKGSVKMLQTQYRMPPEICNFLSDRFYDGELTTAEHKLLQVSQDCRRSNALEWIDYTHGRESQEGTSKYNEMELDIIVDLLTSRPELASDRLSAASEKVMVITFYAAQARHLQDRVQATRPDVVVMTVDSAQGSETDYVILSCVRCNGSNDIGRFVADDRRVNVAMSRARKQLIVVGSSKTLVRRQTFSQDLWSSFKEYTDALRIPLRLTPRTFCGGIDTPRWDVKDGGREVDLRLFPERRSFTDDEMEELAQQLPELLVFKSSGRSGRPLSIKVDCAERGFGDRGMKAICQALISIHRPKMRARLFFYKLRLTDASMPHVAAVLERYQGMVLECHLSHNNITNTGAKRLLVKEVIQHYPSPGRYLCQPLWLRLEQCKVIGRNLNLPEWMYTPESTKMRPQQNCPAVQMPYLDLPVPPADAHRSRPPG